MKIHLTAEYRVRPGAVEEAIDANRAVIHEIAEHEPGTVYYRSLQRTDDPTWFVNTMAFVDEAALQHHRETPHVKAYVDRLYPLCEAEPEFTQFTLVGTTER